MPGAVDDFGSRFRLQREAQEAAHRAAVLQAEYDDRERAREARAAALCAGCGQRDFHWPGCAREGTDDRRVVTP